MDENIKELFDKIKVEVSKLKDIDNEAVQKVYAKLSEYVKVDAKEDAPKEKESEEKSKEEKPTESQEEDKVESEVKDTDKAEPEEKKEEVKVEEKKEEPKEDVSKKAEEAEQKVESELSAEVSNKLKEAALELGRLEKNITAKEEVIKIQKSKMIELEAELSKYKKIEELELQKKVDLKINKLVELYNGLGMKKDAETIKLAFDEKQVDQLIIDLSAMKPSVSERAVRKTRLSSELELSKFAAKPIEQAPSDKEQANALFGIF